MLDRIRALAGSSLDKTEGLSAEGRITPANGRFHLTLLVRDGRDVRKRVIASDSCADLAGAAAITLALLLGIDVSAAEPGAAAPKDGASGAAGKVPQVNAADADAGHQAARQDRERKAVRIAARKATSPPSAEPQPRPMGPAARGWDLLVRAPIVVGDLGPLPNPSLGAGAGVGMRYDSWRVLLAGHVYLGQTADAGAGANSAPAPN